MPRPAFLPDLLDLHLDELGFLFGQWRAALRDPDHTIASVAHLEERIRAHLQGIGVPGEHALPRLHELLDGDEPDLAFASAYSLLHLHASTSTDRVLDRFASATDELLAALGLALEHAPSLPANAIARLRTLLSAKPTARAIAAAEVLAFHRALDLTGDQLRYFLEDASPAVRRAAWRVAVLVDAHVDPKSYAAALRDDDPAVATAALTAGAWCRHPALLPALRQLADGATPLAEPALLLLAQLGGPEDLPRFLNVVSTPDLGPSRFRTAAAFGAPALVPLILVALDDPDPATAAAAGAAYTKMTGVDVESNQRATVPPADGSTPDDFEAEFLEQVMLPDAPRARRDWDERRSECEPAVRLCRGVDVSRPLHHESFDLLDMESRRQLFLRSRFHGAWSGALLDLERFPRSSTRDLARDADAVSLPRASLAHGVSSATMPGVAAPPA